MAFSMDFTFPMLLLQMAFTSPKYAISLCDGAFSSAHFSSANVTQYGARGASEPAPGIDGDRHPQFSKPPSRATVPRSPALLPNHKDSNPVRRQGDMVGSPGKPVPEAGFVRQSVQIAASHDLSLVVGVILRRSR